MARMDIKEQQSPSSRHSLTAVYIVSLFTIIILIAVLTLSTAPFYKENNQISGQGLGWFIHVVTSTRKAGKYFNQANQVFSRQNHCTNRNPLFNSPDLLFKGDFLRRDAECTSLNSEHFVRNSTVAERLLTTETCVLAQWQEKEDVERDLGIGRRVRCYTNTTDRSFKKEHGGGLIVSYKYKLIYVPNMKVASQMFKELLEEQLEGEGINQNSLHKYLMEKNHSLDDYFVFTFVREPLSHFLSAYAEVDRRLDRQQKPGYTPRGFLQIPRNSTNEPGRAITALTNVRNGVFRGLTPSHLYTQFWKINRCLTRNKMPLIFNFIGRIESVHEDWKTIETLVNLPKQKIILTHSRSHAYKRHAKSIKLDPTNTNHENVALVREICNYYRLDFECFGYPLPKVCIPAVSDIKQDNI